MHTGGTVVKRIGAVAVLIAAISFVLCAQAFASEGRLTSSGVKQAAMEMKKFEPTMNTASVKSVKLKGKPWINKSGKRGKFHLKVTFNKGYCIHDYSIAYLRGGFIRMTWKGSQSYGSNRWCIAKTKSMEILASSAGM